MEIYQHCMKLEDLFEDPWALSRSSSKPSPNPKSPNPDRMRNDTKQKREEKEVPWIEKERERDAIRSSSSSRKQRKRGFAVGREAEKEEKVGEGGDGFLMNYLGMIDGVVQSFSGVRLTDGHGCSWARPAQSVTTQTSNRAPRVGDWPWKISQ